MHAVKEMREKNCKFKVSLPFLCGQKRGSSIIMKEWVFFFCELIRIINLIPSTAAHQVNHDHNNPVV